MGKRNESLESPVGDLKGVGPKISQAFARRAINTIRDLIFFLPSRYEDRREVRAIGELGEGEKALVVARVLTRGSLSFRRARTTGYQVVVEDGTGMIALKWFHRPPHFLKNSVVKGSLVLVSGKVSSFGSQIQMVHPDVIPLDSEGEAEEHKAIVPIYPEIEGVKQGALKGLMRRAFEDWGDSIESIIPGEVESSRGLVTLREAVRGLHFPTRLISPEEVSRAMGRLIVEEFFFFQTAMLMMREETKGGSGVGIGARAGLYEKAVKDLPFELTAAQKRVMGEIEGDMKDGRPMNRLLQGDVGSGKTVLAILASCIAIGNGFQVAFMAPTEILAEQHYLTVHRFFEASGVPLLYLRGDMGRERKEAVGKIGSGEASIVIGTHALIGKDVAFRKLGLVVVDEQHRFGVAERRALKQKGLMPHVLVMSATPIPRTLSLTIHGDLDVSVLDELPGGRRRVVTQVLSDSTRSEVYRMIEDELTKGHQAFVVYPLVDESEKMELPDAVGMATEMRAVFPGRRIGLLHGRMKAEEKEGVMSSFKAGDIDLLVCTTVIEVGIDAPNATLIVIERAERFGLSQLHQLRGRVGRSVFPSKCLLLTTGKRTEQATRRLKIMEKTNDGFVIAEEDLKIRGPGEMMGVRQSGVPGFRVGDLARDGELMLLAREMAREAMERWRPEEADRVRAFITKAWAHGVRMFDVA
jgi:ATP-dependent DNA helicase RecG